jgi:hypothetical protein
MRSWRKACRLLVAVGLLGCFACGVTRDGDVAARLEGRWLWTGSSGGIVGNVKTVHPHAAARTLEFGTDGKARFRIGADVTETRSFTVRPTRSIFHGVERPALFYKGSDEGQIIEFSDGGRTLTLSQNVYDGFSSTYKRVI